VQTFRTRLVRPTRFPCVECFVFPPRAFLIAGTGSIQEPFLFQTMPCIIAEHNVAVKSQFDPLLFFDTLLANNLL